MCVTSKFAVPLDITNGEIQRTRAETSRQRPPTLRLRPRPIPYRSRYCTTNKSIEETQQHNVKFHRVLQSKNTCLESLWLILEEVVSGKFSIIQCAYPSCDIGRLKNLVPVNNIRWPTKSNISHDGSSLISGVYKFTMCVLTTYSRWQPSKILLPTYSLAKVQKNAKAYQHAQYTLLHNTQGNWHISTISYFTFWKNLLHLFLCNVR